MDWEEKIRLIQEIIFYNLSVSSFVSSKAPPPPPDFASTTASSKWSMNFRIQLTIWLARDEAVFLVPPAHYYLAKHISGDSKEAIDPEQFWKSSEVVQRTETFAI